MQGLSAQLTVAGKGLCQELEGQVSAGAAESWGGGEDSLYLGAEHTQGLLGSPPHPPSLGRAPGEFSGLEPDSPGLECDSLGGGDQQLAFWG